MSWERLATGIDAQWTADSGSGGLVELVPNGLWITQADDQTARPLAVFDLVADEPSDFFPTSVVAIEYTWQIAVYIDAHASLAQNTKRDIGERLRTVYHRTTPTVDGGYTASHHFYEGTVQDTRQDDSLVLIQQYRTTLTK